MEHKATYEELEMSTIAFDAEDVIVTSNENGLPDVADPDA